MICYIVKYIDNEMSEPVVDTLWTTYEGAFERMGELKQEKTEVWIDRYGLTDD